MPMKNRVRWTVAAWICLVLGAALTARTPSAAEPGSRRVPVLVELFTSEGCSSCPPADQVLARLLEQQPVSGVEIIGLGEHVDYWNRLGWADPFSDPRFTDRQRRYARALRGSGLYTPQAVVDGRTHFVGSEQDAVVEAIEHARREPKVAIDLHGSGQTGGEVTLAIQVASLAGQHPDDTADIVLAVTEDNLSSQVTRGENQGQRLTHAAVVRRMSVIGSVKGRGGFASRVAVPIEARWKREYVRAIVFAQDVETRAVLGAASARLN